MTNKMHGIRLNPSEESALNELTVSENKNKSEVLREGLALVLESRGLTEKYLYQQELHENVSDSETLKLSGELQKLLFRIDVAHKSDKITEVIKKL
jgi:Arc/MetJ-type ribon-helix-helix transcriptional regulator